MAATACLFNLSKAELGTKIHPKILKEIVKSMTNCFVTITAYGSILADLDAMETFPQHQQLQKNVLLTICSDRILQEVVSKYLLSSLHYTLVFRSILTNTGVPGWYSTASVPGATLP